MKDATIKGEVGKCLKHIRSSLESVRIRRAEIEAISISGFYGIHDPLETAQMHLSNIADLIGVTSEECNLASE